ncbi:MAG: tetratricopeptide repeat protein [Candidatus Rokubacteria bacterium]|nr:tetratricopeptide repeat protein [Candidatus Rokubacteria bacterium]
MKVALEGERRAELQGEVVAFDRFWMRVKLGASKATAREGSNVVLELANLDGKPAIQANGIVWRAPGDGLITVLLSLSSQEYGRLKALVSASADSRSALSPWMLGLVSSPPQAEAPTSVRRPAPEPESPARAAEPRAKSPGRGPGSEKEMRRPVAPRRARRVSPAEEAAILMARGDHEGAARLYSEAVRESPEDVSLWYALGAALHRLRRWREAAEAFEYVIGHGRPDSRDVRLARLWLERGRIAREPAPEGPAQARAAGVEPGPEPSEAEGQDAPEEPDPEPSEPSLVQQAAMLEARGEYREAAKLYYQGLQASPQDASLWYALGTTLHRMDRSKAAAGAFEKAVEHGQPDSREVELARLWLEGRDAPAESTAPDVGAEPEQQDHAGAPSASAEPDAEPSVASAVPEPPAPSSSARQAALRAAQGDYEGAAQLYYRAFEQALGAAPDDVLLWYALGVTLQHLSQGKAAARAFERVVQHGRPGSREVRLARLWLEIGDAAVGPVGVATPAAEAAALPAEGAGASTPIHTEIPAAPPELPAPPSGRGATARRRPSATPVVPLDDPWELGRAFDRDMPVPKVVEREEPADSDAADLEPSSPSSDGPRTRRDVHRPSRSGRTKQPGPNPAEEAAILAGRGDYEEAARLYSEALQAAPGDVSLWYALGVTLRHLRRLAEAGEAFEYVVRHGRPGSQEARLARLWLERGGTGEEPGARP